MTRYVCIAVIAIGIVALALAGWAVKGARRIAAAGRPRQSLRPAVA